MLLVPQDSLGYHENAGRLIGGAQQILNENKEQMWENLQRNPFPKGESLSKPGSTVKILRRAMAIGY